MHLPYISADNKSRDYVDVFGGYNHNPRINDNEFYDMKNLSSDSYPLLSTRARRGSIPSDMTLSGRMLSNSGMIYRNGLYYISFGDQRTPTEYLAYMIGQGDNGAEVIAVWSSSDITTIRQIIPMGAKLIVLPDNIVVNTTTPSTELNTNAVRINNTRSSSGTVSIQPCLEDGTVLSVDYVGNDTPDTPPDGYVWLDTKYSPASLKKYYAASGMWQSFLSSYVKISDTASYISDGFAVGDGVDISGVTVTDKLNDVAIVKLIPDRKSLVVSGTIDVMPDKSILEAQLTKKGQAILCYCDSSVRDGDFNGKTLKIAGGNEVVCASNTNTGAVTAEYRVGGDPLAVNTYTLQYDTTKGNQQGSIIYVNDIASAGGFNGRLTGRSVLIGDIQYERVVTVVATGSEQGGAAYIVVDTELPSLPNTTVISPVIVVKPNNKYQTTLNFSADVSVKMGDKICPSIETQYTQSTAVTFSRKMPQMDFIIESQNRLWGCRYGLANNGEFVNEIYCSKLGDEKNWQVYQGISTDSYRASVGSEGKWTGAANFRGYPVFFKENHIHSVLGNNPPYQISDTTARGIQKGSSASLAMVNEVLYYKSIHGICAYSGGLPADVSSALGDIPYKDAIACAFKGKYYVCMKDIANNPVMFVFDTVRGLWHKEDDFYPAQFAVADNDVYFIREIDGEYVSGSLLGTGGADRSPVEWYAETGLYGVQMIDSKYISRINLRIKIPVGHYMFVSIMYDSSGEWEQLGNVIGHSLTPFTLPIKPRRCDHFRLRLEGSGEMRLYSISKTIEQGSDRC